MKDIGDEVYVISGGTVTFGVIIGVRISIVKSVIEYEVQTGTKEINPDKVDRDFVITLNSYNVFDSKEKAVECFLVGADDHKKPLKQFAYNLKKKLNRGGINEDPK